MLPHPRTHPPTHASHGRTDRGWLRDPLKFLAPELASRRPNYALTAVGFMRSKAWAWKTGPDLSHWTAIDAHLRLFREFDVYLSGGTCVRVGGWVGGWMCV